MRNVVCRRLVIPDSFFPPAAYLLILLCWLSLEFEINSTCTLSQWIEACICRVRKTGREHGRSRTVHGFVRGFDNRIIAHAHALCVEILPSICKMLDRCCWCCGTYGSSTEVSADQRALETVPLLMITALVVSHRDSKGSFEGLFEF